MSAILLLPIAYPLAPSVGLRTLICLSFFVIRDSSSLSPSPALLSVKRVCARASVFFCSSVPANFINLPRKACLIAIPAVWFCFLASARYRLSSSASFSATSTLRFYSAASKRTGSNSFSTHITMLKHEIATAAPLTNIEMRSRSCPLRW